MRAGSPTAIQPSGTDRPGGEHGAQMHDGVDAHLGFAADPRAVEDRWRPSR